MIDWLIEALPSMMLGSQAVLPFTGLPVALAEDPRNVVIRGMGKIANDPAEFSPLFV